MEKVFLLPGELSAIAATRQVSNERFVGGAAVIEKTLGSGKYIVVIGDRTRLTALGPEGLEKGTKVQVAPFSSRATDRAKDIPLPVSELKGEKWLAKFPLCLESGTSEVKLELYVEADKPGLFGKKEPVIHLVFTIKTATLGLVQWSVYLRQNQVLARVYFEKSGGDKQEIGRIIQEFEDSLKKKGFSLLAPTVILKRPFKASAGLQLNIQG